MRKRSMLRLRALLVTGSLLLPAHGAMAHGPELSTPPVRLDQVVPTVMEATATMPIDLDGDGADDFVVLSRDGVAQRYLPDGTPVWSTSYVEIADALGVATSEENDAFWADFDGISSCGSGRSVAFHDVTGDGIQDVFALLWLRTVEPEGRVWTVVVQLDGATGSVIRVEPRMGRVLAQAVGDLDADGRAELVVVEEDGPPVTWDSAGDPKPEGTGRTATVWAADAITGEQRWTFDTGLTWPVTSGLSLVPGATGRDVAVSLGGSNEIVRCTGSDIGDQPQRILSLDGATGAVRWEAEADAVAQDLIALSDGGLVTWTDDAGGVVEVLEAADGSRRWRATGLGGGGVLGAVSRAEDRLAVLSARPVDGGENETRLAFLDAATGAVVEDVRVDGSDDSESGEMPTIDDLRLAETGMEGSGEPVVLARTPRTVSAITADAGLPWQEPGDGTAPHVLLASHGPDGDRVWTQGSLLTSRFEIEGVPLSIGSRTDTGLYRLTGRSVTTGEEDATLPLLANVLGATRADVSADGVPDRVVGGLGEVLMATDGVTGDVRWRADLGREIVDVWPEDLDGDGSQDFLVEAYQATFGVRGHDGEVLWSFGLEFPLFDGFAQGAGGTWRDIEVVDMTGDGVRDLVLGFRTARDEAWAPAGNGKVIVVNGATGAEHWRAELPPFVKGVQAVAVGDATGDGVPDVAAALDAVGDTVYYGVVLLDGTDGSQVWAHHDVTGGARDVWGINSVEMIDHGGDGELDVAVLTRQFGGNVSQLRYPADVRVHDAGSGVVVASAGVTIPGVELMGVVALQTADFGPAGRLLVAYGRYSTPDGRHTLVHAYDPRDLGTRFALGVPTGEYPYEPATGDVTGDGIADLIAPTTDGLVVADGGAALDGDVHVLARTAPHHPLKTVFVDADGDGVDELETLETPAGWPLQIGPAFINHTVGVVRSVGLLDLSP